MNAQLKMMKKSSLQKKERTPQADVPITTGRIKQSQVTAFSDTVNNPFEQVSKLFAQTPLIRVTTQDLTIRVPMIYAEDINRYKAYLSGRVTRNRDILISWQNLIQ